MEFSKTILLSGTLDILTPKTLPALFSAARSEFLLTKDYKSRFTKEMERVFDEIAKNVYGTRFLWSEYNKKQWGKFIASAASGPEGGACMFSLESDNNYTGQSAISFKGLGLGVPTGMFPYSLWVTNPKLLPLLQSTVAGLGPYSLDLVSDH